MEESAVRCGPENVWKLQEHGAELFRIAAAICALRVVARGRQVSYQADLRHVAGSHRANSPICITAAKLYVVKCVYSNSPSIKHIIHPCLRGRSLNRFRPQMSAILRVGSQGYCHAASTAVNGRAVMFGASGYARSPGCSSSRSARETLFLPWRLSFIERSTCRTEISRIAEVLSVFWPGGASVLDFDPCLRSLWCSKPLRF